MSNSTTPTPSISGSPASDQVIGETPPDAKQAIIATLRQLHARREPLNIIAVKRRHPGLVEKVYAIRPYWGWRQALRDAGLDYDTIHTELLDTCPCLICGRHFAGLSAHLIRIHETTAEEYLEEFPGAELVCESRRAQAREHGKNFPLVHWERVWSWEYLCDRAWESHQRGWEMSHNVVLKRDLNIMVWTRRLGRKWDDVLTAIGLDPRQVRRLIESQLLTKTDIIERLRERHRAGLPIHLSAMMEQEPNFRAQAERRFGNYRRALKAAGFDPNKIARKVAYYSATHRKVFEKQLQKAAALPRDKRRQAMLRLRENWQPLIKSNPGGLMSWCGRLGIDYALVDLHVGYGKAEEVVEEIRRQLQAGHESKAIAQKTSRLHSAALRYFGSWRAAVELARSNLNGPQLDSAIHDAICPYPLIMARLERELRKLANTPPECREAERDGFTARWHFLLLAKKSVVAEACVRLGIDERIVKMPA